MLRSLPFVPSRLRRLVPRKLASLVKVAIAAAMRAVGLGTLVKTSQFGIEDELDHEFHGRRNGRFVEVGGYDGITQSNTWWLETARDWSGLLVEPVCYNYRLAAALRRCRVIFGAATALAGPVRIDEAAGRTMSGHGDTIVPGLPLRLLTQELGWESLDVLVVDVEGAELDVLRGFDWGLRPRLIILERNDEAALNYAISKGYGLHSWQTPADWVLTPLSNSLDG